MARDVSIKWFGPKVIRQIRTGMGRRLALVAADLRGKVVRNLSVPVKKIRRRITRGPNKGKIRTVVDPTSRSKPGEFPRADTTRLMKDIFWTVGNSAQKRNASAASGRVGTSAPLRATVGTTLKYGLILETKLDRSFLRRTFRQQQAIYARILSLPLNIRE